MITAWRTKRLMDAAATLRVMEVATGRQRPKLSRAQRRAMQFPKNRRRR